MSSTLMHKGKHVYQSQPDVLNLPDPMMRNQPPERPIVRKPLNDVTTEVTNVSSIDQSTLEKHNCISDGERKSCT